MRKGVKYSVGDVVKLCDGLDYNSGNSLSYQEGIVCEILGKDKDGKFIVYEFYRPVETDEIEKRIYTNARKWTKFGHYLQNVCREVWICEHRDENAEHCFKPVQIDGFSFNYNEYMYVSGEHLLRLGTEVSFTEFDAWKKETKRLWRRTKKLYELLGEAKTLSW